MHFGVETAAILFKVKRYEPGFLQNDMPASFSCPPLLLTHASSSLMEKTKADHCVNSPTT